MKSIYVKFWNPDTNEDEWRVFYTSEIQSLYDLGIIDEDGIGYAMKNQEAFDSVMLELAEKQGGFTLQDFVERYIDMTGEEIRIE